MLKRVWVLMIGSLFSSLLCATEIAEVSAEQLLLKQQQQQDFLLLDVRSDAEFLAGHISGAVHVDYENINANIELLTPYKTKEIVVYCRSGRRAGIAIEQLKQLGFTSLSHLSGDVIGWNNASRPLVR